MRNILLIFSLLFLVACGGTSESNGEATATVDPLQSIKDEAMAVHDEVMPLMGPIDKMQKTLATQKEGLTEDSPVSAEEIDAMIQRLADANQGMMTWMNDFQTQVVKASSEPSMDVLRKLKDDVMIVKEAMTEAKADAEAMLSSFE
ncbi:MAG: hypothetical protein AAFP02_20150 [Bacteroidota bacterium]